MTYLLDTCIVSKLRKIKKIPDPKLETWFGKHSDDDFFLSCLTVGEIQNGISKLRIIDAEQAKQKRILEEWLYAQLLPKFQGRILSIDKSIALLWGKLVGEKKAEGIIIPAADALIAATAIHHNLILVTENIRDFQATGAVLFNPWDLS